MYNEYTQHITIKDKVLQPRFTFSRMPSILALVSKMLLTVWAYFDMTVVMLLCLKKAINHCYHLLGSFSCFHIVLDIVTGDSMFSKLIFCLINQ